MPWLLSGSLWVSAYLAIRRWGRLSFEETWLAAGLICCAEALGIVGILGVLRHLSFIPTLNLTCLWIGIHLLAVVFGPPPIRPSSPRGLWRVYWPKPLWPAILFAAAVFVFQFHLAAALPPDSWDALTYHLPLSLRWVQQGNFDLTGWPDIYRYYPWNSELLTTWLALLDKGDLAAAKMAQVLALPILAASGAVLGRRIAGPSWAGATALAMVCLPVGILQSSIANADLFYAAFWLAAAAAAVGYEQSGKSVYLYLYALAFGLTLGTKATVYFQIPLLIPLLWPAWCTPALRPPLRKAWPALAAVVLLAGGLSYLRNGLTTGNPFFPFTVRFAGVPLLHGPLEVAAITGRFEEWFVALPGDWLLYPLRETFKGVAGYSHENGFGPLVAAGYVLLPYALWKAYRRLDMGALSLFTAAGLAGFFFLQIHPVRIPRFVIFMAGLFIVALAYALSRLSGRWRVGALAGWSAGILFGLLGVLACLGANPVMRRAWLQLRENGSMDPDDYYRSQFGPVGEAAAELNKHLLPGEGVAVTYGELTLPWAGTPPRGKVFVISHKASRRFRGYVAEKPEDWMALLDRLNARYLALWSPAWDPEEGRAEKTSITRFARRFKSLGAWESNELGEVALYKILPAASPRRRPTVQKPQRPWR